MLVTGFSGGRTEPERGKIKIISQIRLHAFKRSLVSAARPNKLGGSENEVNEILQNLR
jgi:hypothetical protein